MDPGDKSILQLQVYKALLAALYYDDERETDTINFTMWMFPDAKTAHAIEMYRIYRTPITTYELAKNIIDSYDPAIVKKYLSWF